MKAWYFNWVLGVPIVLVSGYACGGSSSSTGRAGPGGCAAGQLRSCQGNASCPGTQTCGSAGDWSACLCSDDGGAQPGAGGAVGTGGSLGSSGGRSGNAGGNVAGDAGSGAAGASGGSSAGGASANGGTENSGGSHTCGNTDDDPWNCGACDHICNIRDNCWGGHCCFHGTCVAGFSPCADVDSQPLTCNEVCAQSGATCVNDGCQSSASLHAVFLRSLENDGVSRCDSAGIDPDANVGGQDPASPRDLCGKVIDGDPSSLYGRARCCCL